MGATCNGCGDCCEQIPLSGQLSADDWRAWFTYYDNATRHSSSSWWYVFQGLGIAGRPWWMRDRSLPFVVKHWRVVARGPGGEALHACDAFDPIARRCAVHGTPEKPPICTDFPWYTHGPSALTLARLPRCSYWQDVSGRLLAPVSFAV